MSAKTEIKNLFSKMLSPKIELNSTELVYDGEDIEKELFIQIIESWGNAWKQQNTLFNKYGIDLSGYDNLLYSSIEKSMILLFGHTKWQIINSYVYSSLNLEEDKLKIAVAIDFDLFWNIYNKKVDKEKCLKVWRKIRVEEIPFILEKAKLYIKSNTDIQYRKNPLTWLNGKCWNDEISAPEKKIVYASHNRIID